MTSEVKMSRSRKKGLNKSDMDEAFDAFLKEVMFLYIYIYIYILYVLFRFTVNDNSKIK